MLTETDQASKVEKGQIIDSTEPEQRETEPHPMNSEVIVNFGTGAAKDEGEKVLYTTDNREKDLLFAAEKSAHNQANGEKEKEEEPDGSFEEIEEPGLGSKKKYMKAGRVRKAKKAVPKPKGGRETADTGLPDDLRDLGWHSGGSSKMKKTGAPIGSAKKAREPFSSVPQKQTHVKQQPKRVEVKQAKTKKRKAEEGAEMPMEGDLLEVKTEDDMPEEDEAKEDDGNDDEKDDKNDAETQRAPRNGGRIFGIRVVPNITWKDIRSTNVRQDAHDLKELVKDLLGIDHFDRYHFFLSIGMLVILSLVLTFPFMLTSVRDTEVGVGYSPLTATFQSKVIPSGGVRQKIWAGTVIRWPRTEQIIDYTSSAAQDVDLTDENNAHVRYEPHVLCNSKDGLQIELFFDVHLKIEERNVIYLTKRYRDFENWFVIVSKQIRSSMMNTCAEITVNDFQQQREVVATNFESSVARDVRKRFRGEVIRLNLKETLRPVLFEDAISSKENARSTIQLAITEEVQEIIKASTTVDIAREERTRVLSSANKTAFVTRETGVRKAESVYHRLEQLNELFGVVKTENSLDVLGILTYIQSETFFEDMTISVEFPSQLTFRN